MARFSSRRPLRFHLGSTGPVAAFFKALKLKDDNMQLRQAVKELCVADELMTELAEAAVNVDAADEWG